MTYWDRKLMREQLDGKLAALKAFSMPQGGWIKSVREALGMSMQQMARKVGISQSRISRLETAEHSGGLKLSSLKKIAEALGMEFVYALVPKESLDDMVTQQARKIALDRMARLNQTMRLEKQELDNEEKLKALENMIQKIMMEDSKGLWDE